MKVHQKDIRVKSYRYWGFCGRKSDVELDIPELDKVLDDENNAQTVGVGPAWNILVKKYHNERLIVNTLKNKIINIPVMQFESAKEHCMTLPMNVWE